MDTADTAAGAVRAVPASVTSVTSATETRAPVPRRAVARAQTTVGATPLGSFARVSEADLAGNEGSKADASLRCVCVCVCVCVCARSRASVCVCVC